MPRNSVAPHLGRVRVWLATGLVTAVLLTGCQPSDDATTPPPSVTASATVGTSGSPTASATPTPSPSLVVTARPTTPEETAALAAEAEFVYREQQRLIDDYQTRGGAANLPSPLNKVTGGIYATAVEATLRSTYEQQRRIEGSTTILKIAVFTEKLQAGSLIGLRFCDDRSKLIHIAKDGVRTALTSRFMNRAEFERGADGVLRMTYNVSRPVEACDAS